jgi:putative MATE family efflux protein
MNDTPAAPQPIFVTGSILRHVLVMSATSAIGLIAIFTVDLLSLLYVSWLGKAELTAAVGYATIVMFFALSINIGLMIAVTALVARALGAGKAEEARVLAGSALAHMVVISLIITCVLLPFVPRVLGLLGAQGETAVVATRFLIITLPSNVLMAIGMGCSGLLRAVGDAKRAMWVTLGGGIVTAALDPILIFGLGMGVDGAAWATVVSRLIFATIGLYGAVHIHAMVTRPRLNRMRADAAPMFAIAGPAVLTNLATPVANAATTAMLARFGDAAIAGGAIIDRLTPVAFGVLFALSGAIGPILSQNWGAGRYDRMRETLRDGLMSAAIYVALVWAVLVMLRHPIAHLFSASGLTADLVAFYCLVSGPTWFFLGGLFVANAAFNNLGMPLYSTAYNWGRATLGTIPFAWAGAMLYGAQGVIAGMGLGAALFGLMAVRTAFRAITKREQAAARATN